MTVRRTLNDIIGKLEKLTEQVEDLRDFVANQPRPARPYSYTPPGAHWHFGTIYLEQRPTKPMSRFGYFNHLAERVQHIVDDDDEAASALAIVELREPLSLSARVHVAGQLLIEHSSLLREKIGSVPDQILPEEFEFNPEDDQPDLETSLEEYLSSLYHVPDEGPF